MKNYGNRRSEEDLQVFKNERIKTKYRLIEQENFSGSKELLEQMQHYERMYREGKPEITDEEWDSLVKQTGYIESLDQVVSPSGRKWAKMGAPLVSLNKIDSIDSLIKFCESHPGDKIIAPKLDGLPYNAFYDLTEDGSLVMSSIGTRGDGVHSLILHEGALDEVEINWLPKVIDQESTEYLLSKGLVIDGKFEIRGEALIDKYRYCEENGLDLDTLVPRSIAAGMFNRIVSSSVQNLKKRLWESLGRPVIAGIEEVPSVDKTHNKESLSVLRTFKIAGRGSDIKSVVVAEISGSLEMFVLYKGSSEYKQGDVCLGTTRFEHLYMIAFSVASKEGNIDRPEIMRRIRGIKYIGDVPDFEDIYKVTSDIEAIIDSVDKVYGTVRGVREPQKPRFKNTSRFALDGLVIKPLDSNSETQNLKRVQKNGSLIISNKPKDQVAIKLPTDPVRTRIVRLIKTTTSLGNVTVRAEIEPTVAEGGAVVKNVNLHNENWLSLPENSWIKEGVECELRMSMDIIPILSKLEE